ncbi:MAG: glycosyltransferase family 2 protein [Lachnospiraceae bacterium]|nr:glycosyltransferase family 2 protein [Lachnospiraceae bacterium]
MGKVRTAASLVKRFGLRRTMFYYAHGRRERAIPFSCFSLNLIEKDRMWKLAKDHPISFAHVGEEGEYWMLLPAGARISTEFIAACTIALNQVKKRPKVIYTDVAISPEVSGDEAFWKISLPNVGEVSACFFPEYSLETAECLDFFGGVICVASAWAKEMGLSDDVEIRNFLRQQAFDEGEVLHIPRILSVQKHPVEFHRQTLVETKSDTPLVSIVIPNKDQRDTLKTCIDSILEKTAYPNYEIVVIENNSEESETFAYYESLQEPVRVVTCETDWNFSYINNFGVKHTKGSLLLFLNNDTQVLDANWLSEMVAYVQRSGVGAVGAKLCYPDGTIQHGGVTVGVRGVAGHAYINWPKEAKGYLHRLEFPQNVSAVTAACMMVPRDVFYQVGGFDESLKVAFNDTDLCMKIRDAGYRIVCLPQVVLTHFESKSRGHDDQNPQKLARFNRESMTFQRRWFHEIINGDPTYNVHLSYEDDNFEVKNLWT